jgi:hypothetical protein
MGLKMVFNKVNTQSKQRNQKSPNTPVLSTDKSAYGWAGLA